MIRLVSTTGHLPSENVNQLRISGYLDHNNILDIVNYFINKFTIKKES